MVPVSLLALLGCAMELQAAESETFRGIAARSGTYKRPLLDVDGKRYELKASDKADAAVAEALDKFSKGDTGRYVIKGTRGTVKGSPPTTSSPCSARTPKGPCAPRTR